MLIVIPEELDCLLDDVANEFAENKDAEIIDSFDEFKKVELKNQKLIFLIELGNDGSNIEMAKIIKFIRNSDENSLFGSVAGLILHSENELYTRSFGREIILTLNMHGCAFLGRPIIEATGSMQSFRSYVKLTNLSSEKVFINNSIEMYDKINASKLPKFKKPKIAVIYSSNINTSNTMDLWESICNKLNYIDIEEIHVENSRIQDCNACSFKTCLHFGENNSCFYGGVVVDEVYPAIKECDALVLICPNYNDNISANIAAVINRLTALFRTTDFTNKYIYAVIVSGYSGSDILAEQIISSMNINKMFILPPYFAIMETANNKGEIAARNDLQEISKGFSDYMKNTLCENNKKEDNSYECKKKKD